MKYKCVILINLKVLGKPFCVSGVYTVLVVDLVQTWHLHDNSLTSVDDKHAIFVNLKDIAIRPESYYRKDKYQSLNFEAPTENSITSFGPEQGHHVEISLFDCELRSWVEKLQHGLCRAEYKKFLLW